MGSAWGTAKDSRLVARIPRRLKERIERAAALEGTTVTDFVIRHLASAANDTIRRHELMELTERDSLRFARAVLDPPDPNQALQDADRRYRER
ncbi:MAG: DUF1778 domain-containing protein, partial [Thermomicrobiaceae bacterium]|nr:DUF1778 domain-containing protein [Thermomicrobiaceae bacterium]